MQVRKNSHSFSLLGSGFTAPCQINCLWSPCIFKKVAILVPMVQLPPVNVEGGWRLAKARLKVINIEMGKKASVPNSNYSTHKRFTLPLSFTLVTIFETESNKSRKHWKKRQAQIQGLRYFPNRGKLSLNLTFEIPIFKDGTDARMAFFLAKSCSVANFSIQKICK